MASGNTSWKLYFLQMLNLGVGQIGFEAKSNKHYHNPAGPESRGSSRGLEACHETLGFLSSVCTATLKFLGQQLPSKLMVSRACTGRSEPWLSRLWQLAPSPDTHSIRFQDPRRALSKVSHLPDGSLALSGRQQSPPASGCHIYWQKLVGEKISGRIFKYVI